jgi:hypothetical protein
MNVEDFDRNFHCPECGRVFSEGLTEVRFEEILTITHSCLRYTHEIKFGLTYLNQYNFGNEECLISMNPYKLVKTTIYFWDFTRKFKDIIEIDRNFSIKEIFDRFSPDGIVEMFSFK